MLQSLSISSNIIFIRHCESTNNCTYELARQKLGSNALASDIEDEIARLHDPDPLLSSRGELQAQALTEFFSKNGLSPLISEKNINDWKIFTSPMRRCLYTTKHIVKSLPGKAVTVLPMIHESDGCFKTLPDGTTIGLPGLTSRDIHSQFENFFCPVEMENGWYKGEKKETSKEFKDRATKVIEFLWRIHYDAIKETGKGVNIILVTHGNLINELISRLTGCSSSIFISNNSGISHLQLWSYNNPQLKEEDEKKKRQLVTAQFINKTDHLTDEKLITGGAAFDDFWVQEYQNLNAVQ